LGDISELRGLITVVGFIAVLGVLFAFIPTEFYSYTEGREITIPETFEALDIQYFSETYNFTVTQGIVESFALGGWNIRFKSHSVAEQMWCYTYDSLWVFEWNYNQFKWFDTQGVQQSVWGWSPDGLSQEHELLAWSELNDNWDEDTNECRWRIANSGTQLTVYFGFDQTLYSNPEDALDNNALEALFCISMDEVNTSLNAWNLVAMLLFFQLPDVHPAINAIMAIPLWITIAYLAYILILKAIPFVTA